MIASPPRADPTVLSQDHIVLTTGRDCLHSRAGDPCWHVVLVKLVVTPGKEPPVF